MSPSFIEQVHYIRIPVKELAVSTNWYAETLGFKKVDQKEDRAVFKVGEGPFLLVLIQTLDETFSHFKRDGEDEFAIGFSSPEIHKFHTHLIEQNVKVEPIQEDDGHLYFHFYDPSGNKLQVHW